MEDTLDTDKAQAPNDEKTPDWRKESRSYKVKAPKSVESTKTSLKRMSRMLFKLEGKMQASENRSQEEKEGQARKGC